jgi:hypothetical protein
MSQNSVLQPERIAQAQIPTTAGTLKRSALWSAETLHSVLPAFTAVVIVMSSALGGAYTAFLSRPIIGELYARDGTLFAYVGSQWAQGRIPYFHMLDIKPPGVFALDAIVFHFIGRSTLALGGVAAVFSACSALAVLLLLRQWGAPMMAYCLGALITATASNLWLYNPGNSAELYLLVPATLSILSFTRGAQPGVLDGLLAGFSAGSAALFKTVGLAPLLAASAALLVLLALKECGTARVVKVLGATWAGMMMPWIAVVVWFARHNAAGLMLEASFPFGYSSSNWRISPMYSALVPIAALKYIGGCAVATAIGVVVLLHRRKELAHRRFYYLWMLTLFWVAADISGALVGGAGAEHYFLCAIPSLATATALLFWYLVEKTPSMTIVHWSLFLLFWAPIVLQQSTDAWRVRTMRHAPNPEDKVADYLKAHKTAGDSLFVWPYYPVVYFRADMPTGIRIIDYHDWENQGKFTTDIASELRAAPPSFIVDDLKLSYPEASGYRRFREFVAANYRLSFQDGQLAVYSAKRPWPE